VPVCRVSARNGGIGGHTFRERTISEIEPFH
jgi:hypothetical protein